jgi:hypothetical protein
MLMTMRPFEARLNSGLERPQFKKCRSMVGQREVAIRPIPALRDVVLSNKETDGPGYLRGNGLADIPLPANATNCL